VAAVVMMMMMTRMRMHDACGMLFFAFHAHVLKKYWEYIYGGGGGGGC